MPGFFLSNVSLPSNLQGYPMLLFFLIALNVKSGALSYLEADDGPRVTLMYRK